MRRHADDLTEIRGVLWNNLNTKGAKHRIVWITQNAIKRTFLCYLTQNRRKWLKPRPILSPIGWRTATSQHILVNGSFIIFSIDEYAFFFFFLKTTIFLMSSWTRAAATDYFASQSIRNFFPPVISHVSFSVYCGEPVRLLTLLCSTRLHRI